MCRPFMLRILHTRQFISSLVLRRHIKTVPASSQKLHDVGDKKERLFTEPASLPTSQLTKAKISNGRYVNPWDGWRDLRVIDIVKFFTGPDNSNIPSKQVLDTTLPILMPDVSQFSKSLASGVRVMWIGHSTVVVQFDGMTIMTDPVFSKRGSPVSFGGPKRYRDPPCKIEELPKLDAIIISHSHYDHLDIASVKRLNARFGAALRWYVPIGLQCWMKSVGCDNVQELTWWEEDNYNGFRFASTPCQHWSKRTPFDTNKSLWCGWAVKGPSHSFFFAGDTGYCPSFAEIGKNYGPFTLAAIPIGAYEPRWFMQQQHINPEEAVKIHIEVGASYSVGIHWGTFPLSCEPYLEPRLKVQEELQKKQDMLGDSKNLQPGCFFTLKHGEIKVVDGIN